MKIYDRYGLFPQTQERMGDLQAKLEAGASIQAVRKEAEARGINAMEFKDLLTRSKRRIYL